VQTGTGRRAADPRRVVRALLVSVVVVAAIGGFGVPVSVAGAATARKASGSSSTSAAALVDAQSLGTAVGSPVFATSDAGGAGSGTGSFDSQATASTVSGIVLTFTLSSFANAKAAKQAFQNLTSGLSGATPVSGVGDQAVSSDQDVYVLKGAQVLHVTSALDQQLVDQANQLKATGQDPSSLYAGLVPASLAATKAAATNMSGKSSNGTGFVLPKGGVDPCRVPAATVGKIYGVSGVSAEHVVSESPPATECRYSLPGIGGVLTFVTAAAQLYNAAYPTDIYAVFEAQSQGSSPTPATSSAYRTQLVAAHIHDDYTYAHQLVSSRGLFDDCKDPEVVKAEYDGSTTLSDAKAKKGLQQVADKFAGQNAEQAPPPKSQELTDAEQQVQQQIQDIKSDLATLNAKLQKLEQAAQAMCKARNAK
jgi:hypothetical protein